MEDILKKLGCEPYVPGQKITVMLTERKLLSLDRVLREGIKKEEKGA